MNSAIIVAIVSFFGTVVGTAGGILASAKLTNYRLEQLEKKVDSQNKIIARLPVIEEKLKNTNRRILKLENQNIFDYENVN